MNKRFWRWPIIIKNGINYFDTAFGYHNGTSEIELGKVIKELGIRERIFIADKLPPWNINADRRRREGFSNPAK